MNNVCYAQISSAIFREVVKRKKLWKIGEPIQSVKKDEVDQFFAFIDNTLDFLAIRENTELFRRMNEFYNVILKSVYIVAHAYKKRIYERHLSRVHNLRGGRVDALVPSKEKLFRNISAGILSNLVEFFTMKENF